MIRQLQMLIALLTLMLLGAMHPASLPAQPGQPAITPLYFTGVVGEDTDQGRRVLLRWYTLEEIQRLPSAVIFRTGPGFPREKLTMVRKTRDAATIRSIIKRPSEGTARADLFAFLTRIYGSHATSDSQVAERMVEVLDGRDGSEAGAFRRMMLVQSNYLAAMIEGLGYMDFVPTAGPWVYELWQGDAQGEATVPLGQITIDASSATYLPAPANLREVQLKARGSSTAPSEANNQRIYLNWDTPPELKQARSALFGFDIHRLGRPLAPGETFDDVQDQTVKINEVPVLPSPAQIEGEEPDQAYLYADWGDGLRGGGLLPVGAVYTYWAVPRDLLGQTGQPSAPAEIMVRDTSAPTPPRGLVVNHRTSITDGTQYLEVSFDAQDEDTATYRIYRFLDYTHVQRNTPFTPIDGFVEGLIAADVMQPTGDRVVHDDTTVSGAIARTFWYCVSAVDAHGNESALSPPAAGTIDDIVGPTLTNGSIRTCVSRKVLDISASGAVNQTAPAVTHWVARFRVIERNPCYTHLEVRRRHWRDTIGNQDSDYQRLPLFSLDVDQSAGGIVGSDILEDVYSTVDAYVYCFRLVDANGRKSEEVCVNPTFNWNGRQEIVYTILGDCDMVTDCVSNTGGVVVVDRNPEGNFEPVDLTVPCTEDAVAVRLYRSFDCVDYGLVGEFPCEASIAGLIDTFASDIATDVCYMVQAIDESGNPGSKRFITPVFHFAGDIAKPTVISVKTAGSVADPHADLVWTGQYSGISHYRVYFTREGEADPGSPLEFSIGNLTYDADTKRFSAKALRADRDLNPIDINVSYNVRVEAVSQSLASKASESVPFFWGATDPDVAAFLWAPRPLPPVQAAPRDTAYYDPRGRVLVPLGTVDLTLRTVDPRTGLMPQLPFTVWRKRTDKANQPWISIAPVFTTINVTERESSFLVEDPFFADSPLPTDNVNSYLYFIDDAGLVRSASYEYYYVQLETTTREIKRLVGPITVTTPNIQ